MKLFATFNNSSKEKGSFIREIFDDISKNYDILNGILSFQTYRRWHKRVMKESNLKFGDSMIDFCTGTGELLIKFYKKFNLSYAVGIDISSGMLDIAQKKIEKIENNNRKIELYNVPAENTGLDEKFNCGTIAFALRNVSNVKEVFCEMKRTVKIGGKVIALELTTPHNKILKKIHEFYLKSMIPFIGLLFSKNKKAYKYLGDSIINFPKPEVIINMMKEAGLKNIEVITLSSGIATIFTGEV